MEPIFDAELQGVASSQIDNEFCLLSAESEARRLACIVRLTDKAETERARGCAKTLALVKEERKVILTLVKKGLEPASRR